MVNGNVSIVTSNPNDWLSYDEANAGQLGPQHSIVATLASASTIIIITRYRYNNSVKKYEVMTLYSLYLLE